MIDLDGETSSLLSFESNIFGFSARKYSWSFFNQQGRCHNTGFSFQKPVIFSPSIYKQMELVLWEQK